MLVIPNKHLRYAAIQKFFNLLPGNKKLLVDVSSQTPDSIISKIKENNYQNYDGVVLLNIDPWRYRDNADLLDFFSQNHNQKFYIQHLGYKHSRLLPNVWEVLFNPVYHSRFITKYVEKSIDAVKGFGCLNRNQQFHRTWLAYQLWNNDLLDEVVYSIYHVDEPSLLRSKLESLENWDTFKQCIPIIYPGTDVGNINDHTTNHLAYQTYCNIVTETEVEFIDHDRSVPIPLVSEKTWKPFLACQIPLFFAAQGHLEYLKNLGFEVFDEFLPNGYDNFDTFQKADAIVEIVSRGKKWISELYFDNLDKIKHNHTLVTSQHIDQLMFDSVVDFVYNKNSGLLNVQ